MNRKIALLCMVFGIFSLAGCAPQEQIVLTDENLNDFQQNPSSVQKIPEDLKIPLPKEVSILMYHYIGDVPTNEKNNILRKDLTVSTANFEEQLKWLSENNYLTLGMTEVVAFANAKDGYWSSLSSFAWPEKPIVLTFDDGYEDAYINALPLLQKYNMRGSFAIITGKVGTPGYMTWDQIKQMQIAGMEIASHSVSHPDLSIAPIVKIKDELTKSRADLENNGIYPVSVFVYPSGKYNLDTIEQLKLAGYIGARTTQNGKVTKESDSYELPVVRIHGATTMEQFVESLK